MVYLSGTHSWNFCLSRSPDGGIPVFPETAGKDNNGIKLSGWVIPIGKGDTLLCCIPYNNRSRSRLSLISRESRTGMGERGRDECQYDPSARGEKSYKRLPQIMGWRARLWPVMTLCLFPSTTVSVWFSRNTRSKGSRLNRERKNHSSWELRLWNGNQVLKV